jgi:tRNA nucleotidyltransferase (CCA-adding enzyme)
MRWPRTTSSTSTSRTADGRDAGVVTIPARAYIVGGAVRDALLGRPEGDRDWVVVGSTPQQMLAAGFRPVGRDFPVFLHPDTQEEYALARTERKTAPGYHGFTFHAAPEVTLEEDLARRDLTINAMARTSDGTLVDPHGGARDLRERVLRHVSPAFAEDPVRLLRLARFAARFPDFTVAPETLALCRRLVDAGEVDALVAERVWQEVARGLMEARPARMLEVLAECGALARLLPGVDASPRRLALVGCAAAAGAPLPARYACLTLHLAAGADPTALAQRLRVDNDCRALAELAQREGAAVEGGAALDGDGLVALLERCDALRQPQRFALLLQVCSCDAQVGGRDAGAFRHALETALRAAAAVDTAPVAAAAVAAGLAGADIGQAIRRERVAAVDRARAASPRL